MVAFELTHSSWKLMFRSKAPKSSCGVRQACKFRLCIEDASQDLRCTHVSNSQLPHEIAELAIHLSSRKTWMGGALARTNEISYLKDILVINIPTFVFLSSKGLVLITADNHTFPWCFATHNGAMEHTESCHTLVHDLDKSFSPWNNRNVGSIFGLFSKILFLSVWRIHIC